MQKRNILTKRAIAQLEKEFDNFTTPTIMMRNIEDIQAFYKKSDIKVDPIGWLGEGWKPGELGIWASNYTAWANFANSSYDHIILMEDDTDMSFIEYWHFDWQYLMDNIPYDWDAIQLMFNSSHSICCFLHQKKINTWNGPILVKRSYASKLISLYYINGKYNFIKKINRSDQRFCKNFHSFEGTNNHRYTILDVDEWLGFNGKVYQLPLFSQNPYLDEIPRIHHINSHKIHRFWWTTGKNDYSLEDFFTYGKEYDNKMTFGVVYE
jgi:hypothetical protein